MLLAGAIALMATQPLAGALAVRIGSRPVTVAGGLAYMAALALVGAAPTLALFAAAVVALAVGSSAMDVSMNAQGIGLAQRAKRPIFASFHAAFSFGAMAGAGAGAIAAGTGLAPAGHLAIAAVLLAAVVLAARAGLLPAATDARRDGPLFARPSRALAGLGALAFCALLAEGAVNDWSAILLDRTTVAGPSLAALGLAAFSLTMGFGRLAADPLAGRLGRVAVVRGGGLLAAAGLALALASDSPALGIAGFALMGAGLASLFPLALGAAGETDGPAAPSLAAVATSGYAAFIAGPAVIGLISEATTLPFAMSLVGVLCLAAAALAGSARQAPTLSPPGADDK
ncbi:MAG: MFS transporter [Thermoleophilia bacterium]